ncbi:MAG: hypothetical protein CTY29_04000 [Methylobacter sp.]|nr:MAG: hypothetical protein CTY29_04000 [Methylobacter sp.]
MFNKLHVWQQGAGLIEVLAGTVVVTVGLLSVASLQTGLVTGSGNNKIRSEALALAGQKLEEFNSAAGKTAYETNIEGNFTDTIQGLNTEFTRTWAIRDDPAFTPSLTPRKKISVQVIWEGEGPEAERSVGLTSGIAWVDPLKTAVLTEVNAAKAQGGGVAPGKPAAAAAAPLGLEIEALTLPPGTTPGKDKQVKLTIKSINEEKASILVLEQIAKDSHFYATAQLNPFASGPGAISVFECESLNCRFVDNILGGVPLRIAGTVYSTSGNGLGLIQVLWSANGSARQCYTQLSQSTGTGTLQAETLAYECLVAGNCNATADGVNGCYPDTTVADEQINAYRVPPGGEYGAVGLLGLNDQAGHEEQVCFLENLADPAIFYNPSGGLNTAYLEPAGKRNYAAKRFMRENGSNQVQTEGINRSYSGHDFLISAKALTPAGNQICKDHASLLAITPAPRDITRTLAQAQANTVLPEKFSSGGAAHTVTGLVTRSGVGLSLFVAESGSCYLNNAGVISTEASQFACVGLEPEMLIEGASADYPQGDASAFAECSAKPAETICAWPESFVKP